MTKREVILKIPKGIHLRIAGMLAKKANEFESEVFIEHNNMKVNCKSVMSIAVLGAMTGDKIVVLANGKDENLAVLSLCSILENDEVKKSEHEIYEKYICGASWMSKDGNLYIVKGFHQEWVDKNSTLLGEGSLDINNSKDVIEKLNWINVMIYRDHTIEFHVRDFDDSVIIRLEKFLKNTNSDWKSAHIFTSEKESIYIKIDKELFELNDGSIKNLLDKKLLVTQYY